MSRKNNAHQHKEQGQSLTEFAISLVVILLLLAGVVDIGRAFFAYIIIRDAAQEGAVYGAIHADHSDIENLVRERVETAFTDPDSPGTSPIDINDLIVTTTVVGDPCAGEHQDVTDHDEDGDTTEFITNAIMVKVDYKLPITMPFLGAVLSSQEINMSAGIENTTMVPICD